MKENKTGWNEGRTEGKDRKGRKKSFVIHGITYRRMEQSLRKL